LKLLPLALLALVACGGDEAPARPPVVLISIDTLRSDRVGAYGYRGTATPNIDALAADGILFERAFSHVPLTLPSHTTILTGLLPAHHGVRDNAGFVLDDRTPTVASILKASGYATGGAVSAYVLRASTHVSNGFDDYDDAIPFIEGAPTGNLARGGEKTVAIAQRWISAHAQSPFLAFVHLFEPHAPYEPTYDADVAAADRHVGALLNMLRNANLYDDALIVLLSDHGEGLREHGEAEHGVLLYREALQVPLIVKLPRNARRGERVSRPVQLIDVLPTIIAVTRTTLPQVDGVSLLDDAGPRPVFSETLYPRLHLGWSDLRSVIDWPGHLIDGPKPELYDTARDPRETRDVRDADRHAYAKLRAALEKAPSTDAAAPRVDPEEARKLAALGYVSAGGSHAKSNLNPREHLGDLDALKETTQLMASHRYAEASRKMEELLARNPGWSDLRSDLGLAYEQLGDLDRAEKTYRAAIAATPELAPDFALSLGDVFLAEGKLDDAGTHARLAMKTNPKGAHELLAHVALQRKDLDEAVREAQAAHSDFLLANIYMARDDPRSALGVMQRIYDESRANGTSLPRGYFTFAGDVFVRLGRPGDARVAYERALQLHPDDAHAREVLGVR
jgi:tetratricopeptide (TPR) repeat protein